MQPRVSIPFVLALLLAHGPAHAEAPSQDAEAAEKGPSAEVATPAEPASGETEASASGDALQAAMRPLLGMVGRWEGTGWSRRGPGEPEHFTSIELIESRLDGRVLLVEGIHYNEAGELAHHAFATISYDPEAELYRFSSHTAEGRSGIFDGRVEDGKFIWGMEIPGRGRARYTLSLADGKWEEIGEFSADGESWGQFFSMELERVAAEP